MRGEPGFFDIDDRLKRLSDLGESTRSVPVGSGFRTLMVAGEAVTDAILAERKK